MTLQRTSTKGFNEPDFTGSSLVRLHGRDPHYGSLINSTIAFRLLTFDAIVKKVSRKENSQLFQLVISTLLVVLYI
jgi:hypothetical protein